MTQVVPSTSPEPAPRVVSERVARAAARALIAVNRKLGVETDERTKRLASRS